MPLFSQIRARVKGPRFLKKRGSAIWVLWRRRYFFGAEGGGALRLTLIAGSFSSVEPQEYSASPPRRWRRPPPWRMTARG